jgi:hypothetical protein
MKTRIGKIARLPKEIRDELNRRMEDGALGPELADWLNGLPEVQKILAEQFGGRPINKFNLSGWRHGGFEDWVHSRDGRIQMREMMDEALKLNQIGNGKDGTDVGDYLGTFILVELSEALDRLHKIKDPDRRWKLLRSVSSELSRLRTDECRKKSLRLRDLKRNQANKGKSRSVEVKK